MLLEYNHNMKKIKIGIIIILLLFSCDNKKDENLIIEKDVKEDAIEEEYFEYKFTDIGHGEIIVSYIHSLELVPVGSSSFVSRYPIILTINENKINLKRNDSKTDYEIEITKEYFNKIFNILMNINYNEIVYLSEDIMGLDGNTIEITLGTFQNRIEVILWSIDYKSDERNTNELKNILVELFSLFDIKIY